MTRGVFIAGTDFGVGKSRIGAMLAAALNARGELVRLCRPATSRISSNHGDLVASPSNSRSQPQLTPYPSGSPAGAAWPTHGLEELHRACVADQEEREFLLVEGCGGFYSPIARHALNADLAGGLGLPVLVIAADHRGAVNHTLMTVEAVRMRNLTLAGVIINQPTPQSYSGTANAQMLECWLQTPVYRVPYELGGETGTSARGTATLARLVDTWLLDRAWPGMCP